MYDRRAGYGTRAAYSRTLAHDGRCVGGCHLERIAAYAEHELARGERLPAITRHMLGLLSHVPGAREYRRLLSEGARAPGAGPELLRQAAQLV
jgi:hypothetical protein